MTMTPSREYSLADGRWIPAVKRASGEPAARAAARLTGGGGSYSNAIVPALTERRMKDAAEEIRAWYNAPMATTEEKLIDEAVSLLSPLAGAALEAVIDVVRLLVTHPEGAELAAKRQAQALAAEAFIRS